MSSRALLFVAIASLTGCASAGAPEIGEKQRPDANTSIDAPQGSGGVDARQGGLDAGSGGSGTVDAAVIPDAPTGNAPQTLSATSGSDSEAFACLNTAQTYTAAEQFYRVFPLADYSTQVPGAFAVSKVDFDVSDVEGGPVTLAISVGVYNGTPGATLTASKLGAPLMTVNQDVNNGDTTASVPIAATIPAGAVLYVEINAPDGSVDDTIFIPGESKTAETEPSYVGGCGSNKIGNFSTATGSKTDLLLTVTGVPQ